MEKLAVSSLRIGNVISDIAREMGTGYTKSCGTFHLEIPESYGRGLISGTDFDSGISIIQYDCTFARDITFEYSVDKVHPVKFLFSLEGQISHSFIDERVWHQIPKYENAIVASSAHNGHRIRFSSGKRVVYLSIELDRGKFQAKVGCQPRTMAIPLRELLNDLTATKRFYRDGLYSPELSMAMEEWGRYPKGD
ncbi:MAG TPA: hypothetical protein ENH60_00900 [Pricia sp.]|uniref:Uncharacterized protein n=2 Tax=root TaxID=1 RepID=A0A831QPJ1_9FLAO|nr:hypothetical protein [Pricia sp.]HEA20828.1 hypothetical protein [Pricia antarctica]